MCQTYLPVDHFSSPKSNSSRVDILGSGRASECRTCANERFLRSDHRSKLLNSAKQRAKANGLDFNLTIDDIVIPEFCPALGIRLVPVVGEGRKSLTKLEASPSLDRVDNSKDYVKGNVCVISLRANNIKKDATLQELKAIAAHMVNPSKDEIVDCSASFVVEAQKLVSERLANRIAEGSPDCADQIALVCSTCKKTLPLDYFYEISNQKSGRLAPDDTIRANGCRDCAMDCFLRSDHRVKLLNAARRRAKNANRVFAITKEDVIIPEYCPVLGIKLKPSVGEGRKNLNELDASPSIDRIDSSKGYTKDNVQVICFRANDLKKDAAAGEIQSLVDYVESFYEANQMTELVFTATNHFGRMGP